MKFTFKGIDIRTTKTVTTSSGSKITKYYMGETDICRYPDTTLVPCWNCRQKIGSIHAVPIAEHNGILICDGFMCSYECVLYFIQQESKKLPEYRDFCYRDSMSLFNKHYPPTKDIPDWRLLESNGGILTPSQWSNIDKVPAKVPIVRYSTSYTT